MTPSPPRTHERPHPAGSLRSDEAAVYRICVQGCLEAHWHGWFAGMELVCDPARETTTMTGLVSDQAALHGLLARVRDLGLPLLSVILVPAEAPKDCFGIRRARVALLQPVEGRPSPRPVTESFSWFQ